MKIGSEDMENGDNATSGKFSIPYKTLQDLADACKSRKFADEVQMYEKLGGDDWLEKGLCSNFRRGISEDSADMKQRFDVFGNNMESSRPPKSLCALIWDALDDFTERILMAAATFSIIVQTSLAPPERRNTEWINGFAILVAVIVCAAVTSINDWQKERQFQELNKVAGDRKRVNVIRNGQLKIIHQSLVMVGDIMKLEEGMEIPADGVVIQAAELTTDEAAMTGQPDPIQKNTLTKCLAKQRAIEEEGCRNQAQSHDVPSCVILSGTRILTGDGKMVVITVGSKSIIGKIKAILKQQDDELTPLQHKLEKLAHDIGKLGLYSAIVIVAVLIIRFTIERISQEDFDHSKHWGELIRFFILGITVVVVAIPEGLPLSVTISLAYSVKKMLKDQNLVRKMQACQTMGGADCICSDKTGTLTTNKMTLTHHWNEQMDDLPYNQEQIDLDSIFPKQFKDLWVTSLSCNGAAILRPEPKGSRTQIALLQFLEKCGIDYELEREIKLVNAAQYKFPFSSARKRMGIVLEYDGKQRLFEKGGSDKITAVCTHFYKRSTDEIIPIDENLKNKIDEAIKTMADKALRTIGLAYKDIQPSDDLTTQDEQSGVFQIETSNLVLVGILGIADVLRAQVPGAIQKCKVASIKVRMVTGDNKDTARAIARDCGIIVDETDVVIEGDQFIDETGGIICQWCGLNQECYCPLDSDALEKRKKQIQSAKETIKTISDNEFKKIKSLKEQNDKRLNYIREQKIVSVTNDDEISQFQTLDPSQIKQLRLYQYSLANPKDVQIRDDTLKDMKRFREMYKQIAVMARSQPEHKYALVTGLKECGHVVAVTGDGTNDAPALKQADVGFAMGIAGTEVARQAASIILLDDNFKSIVSACVWGRNIYDSIRKFIQFQLTVNVVAVVITLIGAGVLKQDVLKPIQMLWINLIMDTFASLALATEPPSETLLERKPQSRSEYIISKNMFKHIFGQAIIQLVILLILLFGGEHFLPEYQDQFDDVLQQDWLENREDFQFDLWWEPKYSSQSLDHVSPGRYFEYNGIDEFYIFIEERYNVPSRHFTLIFNIFVLMQLVNFMNSRKLKDDFNIFEGMSRNPMFMVIVGLCVGFQVFIVTFGGLAFSCYTYYGLNIQQWLISIGFSLIGLAWSIVLQLIPEDKCIQAGNKSSDPNNPSQILRLQSGDHIRKASLNNMDGKQQSQPSVYQPQNINYNPRLII